MLPEVLIQLVVGFPLLGGHDVGVGVHRHPDGGVAQAFLYYFGVNVEGQEQSSVAMRKSWKRMSGRPACFNRGLKHWRRTPAQ